MTKKTLIVVLAALLAGAVLFAQRGSFQRGMPPEGPQTDLVATYLGLSDQQVQGLKEAQSAFRTEAEPTMQKLGEKSRTLREAMQASAPDPALISQLKAEIEELQKQLQDLHSQYRLRAQGLLTGTQQLKLAALQEAMKLVPTANQAAFLNLVEPPQGFAGGPGGPGMGGGRGPGGRMEGRPHP